jgi:hypothetical protein
MLFRSTIQNLFLLFQGYCTRIMKICENIYLHIYTATMQCFDSTECFLWVRIQLKISIGIQILFLLELME